MNEQKVVVNTKNVIKPGKDSILDFPFDISKFINDEPDPIEWAIPNLIPCNITGMITGMGGTGKSTLILDLMVSIACGVSFLGNDNWKPEKPNKVLCVFGEETKEIIHRRLKKIIKYKQLSKDQEQLIIQNMIVFSSHGENPAFSTGEEKTKFYNNLIGKIETIEPILVILDPLSRFYKADENDNTKATRFVELLEKLKTHQTLNEKQKTSVMIAHHTNKGTANNQTSSRGASAFVDGVRWQCLLNRIETNLAGEPIEPKDRNLIAMTIPKSNYLQYGVNDRVLKVLDDLHDNGCGGVLVECDQFEVESLKSGNVAEYNAKVNEYYTKKTKEPTRKKSPSLY